MKASQVNERTISSIQKQMLLSLLLRETLHFIQLNITIASDQWIAPLAC